MLIGRYRVYKVNLPSQPAILRATYSHISMSLLTISSSCPPPPPLPFCLLQYADLGGSSHWRNLYVSTIINT